jgi:hypothetical protein
MARRMSPYQRGWEAGFTKGWQAREEKSTENWAEALLTIKPSDLTDAAQRIAKRAERPAGDDRADFPGLAVMRAEVAHRSQHHGDVFELCELEPCNLYDRTGRVNALLFRAAQESEPAGHAG